MPKDSALNKALVIFSGGLDSTVCLYQAKKEFLHVEALSFDYNQRHKKEILYAQLCGLLQSPIAKLAYVLQEISKKQGGAEASSVSVEQGV